MLYFEAKITEKQSITDNLLLLIKFSLTHIAKDILIYIALLFPPRLPEFLTRWHNFQTQRVNCTGGYTVECAGHYGGKEDGWTTIGKWMDDEGLWFSRLKIIDIYSYSHQTIVFVCFSFIKIYCVWRIESIALDDGRTPNTFRGGLTKRSKARMLEVNFLHQGLYVSFTHLQIPQTQHNRWFTYTFHYLTLNL